MKRHTRSSVAALLLLFITVGCGGDDGAGPAAAGDTGTLLGQVRSPHAGGNEAVEGAIVQVAGGPSAVTDASGSFRMSGVPVGGRVVVRVAGPQSKDANHPLTHSSQEFIVSVSKGEEVQLFPTLIMGCRRVFETGANAVIDIGACGGGGEVMLTFEPGDLANASGTFSGTVLADIVAFDPNVVEQAAAFNHGEETSPDEGSFFGGVEVRLWDFGTGEPLQVAAGQSVAVRVKITDLGGVSAGDLTVERYDETAQDWVGVASGTVTTAGNDTYYEWAATHFSNQRVIAIGGGVGPKSCLSLTAELPGSEVPLISGFVTEMKTRLVSGPYRGKTDCMVVRQRNDIQVRLRYVAPWDGSVWETPWFAAGNIPETVCGSCVDLGHHDLEQYRVGGSGDPVARFLVTPSPAEVGEEVTLDASASTDDGGIINYAWDVDNDGVLERYGRVAKYTYGTAGVKNIRLRVSDANGNVDAEIQQLQVTGGGGAMPTLTVQIVGEGSVTSEPMGIACAPQGGTCEYEFAASTFITLTANAYPGYMLQSMSGCNDQDPGKCYVILESDRTVTFTFVPVDG